MWTPLQQQRIPTDQQHAASSSSSVPLTSTPSRRRGSLRRSLNKTSQPEMPRLMASVSGPSALVGGRSFPLDASFRSDISVLSTASANNDKRKSWFCGSCSYRNCDMNQSTCALCGCGRGVMSSSSSTPGSSAKQTIFTIDSSIQLLSRPNGEGVALCSTTTCSRTTGTSVSTRVVSNTTAHKNNLRRIRPRTQDDEEVVQPPVVSHHTDDEIDDMVSIASEDTYRRGSLSDRSSQDNSSNSQASRRPQHPSKLNAEASRRPESPARSSSGSSDSSDCSSSDSSSRRRAMPHDDPMEQPSAYQQQRRNRRRGQEDNGSAETRDSPRKPVRATEEPLELSPLPSAAGKNRSGKGGRKKKSIKDYIPGLRNRRRRSSATASTAASSSSANSVPAAAAPSPSSCHGKMETPSTNHTTPLDESFPYCTYDDLEEEEEEEASFHNDCDHFAHYACGTQVVHLVGGGRAMPRRAVAGIYDV